MLLDTLAASALGNMLAGKPKVSGGGVIKLVKELLSW